jgi:hypothetical protein
LSAPNYLTEVAELKCSILAETLGMRNNDQNFVLDRRMSAISVLALAWQELALVAS